MKRINESEIYRWFDVFKNNGQLTEIRLIDNAGKTGSGYFTNAKSIIEAIRPYVDRHNIYFTINSVNPECYGRVQKDKIVLNPKSTTTDSEIIGRDYVFIDLDSKRVSGSNATKVQVDYTLKKTNKIYSFLRANGFNEPIVCFSGNGAHIYLKCALSPTQENNLVVKRFIMALAMMFSDDKVDIDQKVFNLGRISRLPGTYSAKGSNEDKERPQRMCYIAKIPKEIKTNDIEYFKKIADLYPEEKVTPTYENRYSVEKFNLDRFVKKYNIPVTGKQEVADGTRYYLEHCLFDDNHKGKDAILFQHNNGAVSYYCFHNSCSDKRWRDVRLLYEPDAYNKRNNYQKDYYPSKAHAKVFNPIEEDGERGKKWLCMQDIKNMDISKLLSIPTGFHKLDQKIVGLFAGELSVLSGLSAAGKTSWLDCLALNIIQKGFKVGIWSGEMQGYRFKGWLNQVAAGKTFVQKKIGYDNFYFVPNNIRELIDVWTKDKIFLYNNNYGYKWEQLFADIVELVEKEKVNIIMLDNLAILNIDGYDGEKYSRQTKFIIDLKEFAKEKNIHVLLVAHPRKENFFLRKESISGTADLTNIADNLFLIHRIGRDFEVRAGEFFGKDKVAEYVNYSTVIEVAKNRQFGVIDYLVGLYFEPESRRLKNEIAEHIVYGWQNDMFDDIGDMPEEFL